MWSLVQLVRNSWPSSFSNTSSCLLHQVLQKLYDWLITNKTFGPYLKITEGRGMPRNAKILAVSMIILFAGYAVIFAIDELIIRIIVAVSGLIGIFYVTFKVPVTEDFDSSHP